MIEQIKFSLNYCGFIDDGKWPHYLWLATINGEVFEYKTGTGHATPYWKPRDGGRNKKPDGPSLANSERQCWIHTPQLKDILGALVLDAGAADKSFDEFCGDYGYSNDSLSAFDLYRACADTGKRLRRALGKDFEAVAMEVEEK